VTPAGIYLQQGQGRKRLTNFGAWITAEVVYDDGAEERKHFEVEAELDGHKQRIELSPSRLPEVRSWALDALGHGAIVYPGRSNAEWALVAIQQHSSELGPVSKRHVYGHTGWRETDAGPVYLHARGAIGASGAVDGVETRLEGAFERFELPDPPQGDAERDAVCASLRLLELAPDRVMVPLLGATYRAVLGRCDFVVFLLGRTGIFKTELAALAQQHFGAGFTAKALPHSWLSTPNAIGEAMFRAKDTVLVVDDFKPEGNTRDHDQMHRSAAQVLRGAGNSAGRNRLGRDGRLRPERPPRCLLLSTGEELPRGESVRGRAVVIDLEPDEVDVAALTSAQKHAREALSAQAMAGYLRWLAGLGMPEFDKRRRAIVEELASTLGADGVHRRSAPAIAELGAGLRLFLEYAEEAGACSRTELAAYSARITKALDEVCRRQREHQAEESPYRRFLGDLRTALVLGMAHLAGVEHGDGPPPVGKEALGWWQDGYGLPVAKGSRAGWADAEFAYLDPDAALTAAERVASGQGRSLGLSSKGLGKELNRAGVLTRTDPARGNVVRKQVGGVRKNVWPMPLAELCGESTITAAGQTGQTGHRPSGAP
jgi:hypothetical protein